MKHERIIEEDIEDFEDERLAKAAGLSILTGLFGAVFFVLCFFFTFGVEKSDMLGNFWLNWAVVWIPILGIIGFSILFWLAKRWEIV